MDTEGFLYAHAQCVMLCYSHDKDLQELLNSTCGAECSVDNLTGCLNADLWTNIWGSCRSKVEQRGQYLASDRFRNILGGEFWSNFQSSHSFLYWKFNPKTNLHLSKKRQNFQLKYIINIITFCFLPKGRNIDDFSASCSSLVYLQCKGLRAFFRTLQHRDSRVVAVGGQMKHQHTSTI